MEFCFQHRKSSAKKYVICLYEVMNSTLRDLRTQRNLLMDTPWIKRGSSYLNVLSDIFQDEIQPCLKKAKNYINKD